MADLELCYTPATELARLIRDGEVSPVDVVSNSLEPIDEVNPALNCFCFVYPEEAMERARAAERAVVAGRPLRPLHGLPIAIKDLTPTRGKRTTMGSYAFEHWVPDESALLVYELLESGAIMVGKTATPEFAYSSFTESPLWGVTRNPWNLERTPGGSSGGSGAAVASGCVPFAEGTDMGGSVRIPASFCGLVGLKPSFGRIPLDFLPTQFDTIQHFGPLARGVEDARLFLSVAQGPDDRDIMSLAPALDLSRAAGLVSRGKEARPRRRPRLRPILERFDALLCPTMSRTARPVEEDDFVYYEDHGDGLYHGLDMTAQFNYVSQCPALSVPAGWSEEGLPIGLQIVPRRYRDDVALEIGAALERVWPWAQQRPPL